MKEQSNTTSAPGVQGYAALRLEDIPIPKQALEQAKKTSEWKQEVAPGISLAVWYASNKKPSVFYQGVDDTDGYKYGALVDYNNPQVKKLDIIVRGLCKKEGHWSNYVCGQIDLNPLLAASADACLSDEADCLRAWTRNEREILVLLTELSKTIRGLADIYNGHVAAATQNGKLDYKILCQRLYKDVENTQASSLYYGEGNAMSRLLAAIQQGIGEAAKVYEGIKNNYEEPHVQITIDQDRCRVDFSIAGYDEEICGPSEDGEQFFSWEVGPAMAEALVLMEKMEESENGISVAHATNNWAEDLNVEAFGDFTVDVDIDDAWCHIDY